MTETSGANTNSVFLLRIVVEGEPQQKQRPRFGKGGRVYTPRTTVAYENAVALTARAAGWKFGVNRLIVKLDFYCGKKKGPKPDLDNLIKAVLDGLQRGNVMKDDRQVVEIHATRKEDADRPRVEIGMRTF